MTDAAARIRHDSRSWWERIDPTAPDRWETLAARGHQWFLLRYGVLPIGLPVALLVDFAAIVRHRELPLLLSAQHGLQLELLVLTVGIPAGLLAGRILWRLGERRAAERQLRRAFEFTDANRPEP